MLRAVAALVDKSLLSVAEREGHSRIMMLETVRAYGRELLAASGDAVVTSRLHAEYYARLAEAAAPGLELDRTHVEGRDLIHCRANLATRTTTDELVATAERLVELGTSGGPAVEIAAGGSDLESCLGNRCYPHVLLDRLSVVGQADDGRSARVE